MSSSGVRRESTQDSRIIRGLIENETAFIESLKPFSSESAISGLGGSGHSQTNSPGGPAGNFVEKSGDVMTGILSFRPVDVFMSDDTIDMTLADDQSNRIIATGEGGTDDDVKFIKIVDPVPDIPFFIQGVIGIDLTFKHKDPSPPDEFHRKIRTFDGNDFVLSGNQNVLAMYDVVSDEIAIIAAGTGTGGGGGGGANTALSNLTDPTAVNQDLNIIDKNILLDHSVGSGGVGAITFHKDGSSAGGTIGEFQFRSVDTQGDNLIFASSTVSKKDGNELGLEDGAWSFTILHDGTQDTFFVLDGTTFVSEVRIEQKLNMDINDIVNIDRAFFFSSTGTAAGFVNIGINSGNTKMVFNVPTGFEWSWTENNVEKWTMSPTLLSGESIILSNSLALSDSSTDPIANGIFTTNGSNVKVMSGGIVRNLSDIGSGTGSDTPWTENHDAAGFQLNNLAHLSSDAVDSADTGFIRMGNGEFMAWESNPASTDEGLFTFNNANRFQFSDHSLVPTLDAGGNLGETGLRWATLWIESIDAASTLTVAGDAILNGNVNIGNEDTDILTMRGQIDINDIAEPATPAAGKITLYVDSVDGVTKVKKSSGSVVSLEGGSSAGNIIEQNNSSVEVNDTGAGQVDFTVDASLELQLRLGVLEPGTTDVVNLGSPTKRFEDANFGGVLTVPTIVGFTVSTNPIDMNGLAINNTGSITPDVDGVANLGSSSRHWDDVFSERYTFRGSGETHAATDRMIRADSTNMLFNMPSGDGYIFLENDSPIFVINNGGGIQPRGDIKFFSGERIVFADSQSGVGAEGLADAIPGTSSNPSQWLLIKIGSTDYVVPAFLAS